MAPPLSLHPDRDDFHLATLVGREREIGRCQVLIQQMLAGHGQVVLIAGEAGIGKTTLITAAMAPLRSDAVQVLTGHCYDLTVTPPYGPWREVLRAIGGQTRSALPDALGDDTALAASPSQDVLFDTIVTAFQDLAADRPLVLILEDLHWADQPSLDLLRVVTRQITSHRILVIATYRDDEITRRHPLFQLLPVLVREGPVDRLHLRRLEREQIRAVTISRYSLSARDQDQLAAYLARLSDGNPFFIHELLTTLEHERVLRIEPDGASLQGLGSVRTPPLLRQVIARRLARLETSTREALDVAAVIGQGVPLDAWQAVTQLPEDQLDAVVQDALDHRILAASSDGSSCTFTHALVREAVYDDIAPTRRRRWHRRTAETLLSLPAPDPDSVAYHFQRAGDVRATDWLIQAGERAQRAHAWFIAADRFEAAVTMLEAMPERDRERGWLLYRISQLRRHLSEQQNIAYLDEALEIAASCGDDELHAVALFGRGLLKCFAGDLTSGLAELEAGSTATERLGHASAPDVRPGGALDRSVHALWLALAGRFDEAVAVAQQALSTATSPSVRGSYRGLAIAYSFLGQVDRAEQAFAREHAMIRAATSDPVSAYLALMQHLIWHVMPYQADNVALRERLLAECDELSNRGKGMFPMLASQSILSMPILLLQGDWDRARDAVTDSDVWLVAPGGQQWQRMWAAVVTHHQGDEGGHWRRMQALLPAGPPLDPESVTTGVVSPLLQLVSQMGFEPSDLEIARGWLEAFDRWLDWSGAVLGRAENAVLWSHYSEVAGDHDQARAQAERALAFASNPRQPLALIAAYRTLGQLATTAGRFNEADDHLQEALALADACAAPFERALVLLARAMLEIARGDRGDARATLREVIRLCEPLSARPTLERAEALLASLDADEQSMGQQRGLSTREIEVLRLIVTRMTDREIAAELFISPRTVTTHVTHILNKLGVTTRTEAAALAIREHLI